MNSLADISALNLDLYVDDQADGCKYVAACETRAFVWLEMYVESCVLVAFISTAKW